MPLVAAPVYVIDDDARIREALTLALAKAGIPSQPFRSAEDFLAVLPEGQPVCGVADVALPGISGLDLLKLLRERNIEHALVMLSSHGDVPTAVEAMRLGAVHFIEKPFDPASLLELIEEAQARFTQCWDERARLAAARERYDALTAREREVMALLLQGLPNKLVAARLGISVRTAEHHRAALMRKMGARTVSHLFQMAALLAREGVEPGGMLGARGAVVMHRSA
jgi:two-component system response regulator FixJ